MPFIECFLIALRLGLTSFGGPVAHLGYFRETYVEEKKWLSDEKFAELLAICQFMPGPASSQLGAAIGHHRGGLLGGFAAWLGFTLPSAVLLILLATGQDFIDQTIGNGWIHGLKVVAVAVVVMAIKGMGQKLCAEWRTQAIALFVAGLLLCLPFGWLQPVLILFCGVLGAFWFSADPETRPIAKTRKFPALHLVLLAVFIGVVALISSYGVADRSWQMAVGLFKTGSLVFGGGHVVLPLLEFEVVGKGLLDQSQFLTGYGAAQAVPGPMFTLSAYLGAVQPMFGNPWLGGLSALVCIFLPGMILLALGMPLWDRFKENQSVRGGLKGANAAVVGLLLAALVFIIESALHSWTDWLVAAFFFLLLLTKKLPVWAVVILGAVLGSTVL